MEKGGNSSRECDFAGTAAVSHVFVGRLAMKAGFADRAICRDATTKSRDFTDFRPLRRILVR